MADLETRSDAPRSNQSNLDIAIGLRPSRILIESHFRAETVLGVPNYTTRRLKT